MAVGGWLEVASRSRPAGGFLDTVAPWVVLAGSVLTLLYFVVRRAAKPATDARESALFDPSTQLEEPPKPDVKERERP